MRVERKVMQLLVLLASAPGTSVSRQQLLDELWGYHVSDDAIHTVVAKLRKALDMGDVKAIETVPKVGYRLLLPVGHDSGPQVIPGTQAAASSRSYSRGRMWVAGVLVAVVVAIAAALSHRSATMAERLTKLVPLTSEPGLEVQPALSPGLGDRVAYVARNDTTRNWDLFVRGVGGGQSVQLTKTSAHEHFPAWSPDATALAVVRFDSERCALWTIDPVGGDERLIGPCPVPDVTTIGWAGPAALVISGRPAGEPYAVFRVPRSGAPPSRLTTPPQASIGDVLGKASPDARTLAVSFSPALGVQDLYVQPIDGGPRRRLTFDNVKIHGFDWTPDGRGLVFSSNRTGLFGLWRIDLAGGAPQHLAATGDDLDGPSVAAGGDRVAYERWLTESSVHEAGLGASTASTSRLAFTRWLWHVDVARRSGALAVVSDRSGSPEVWTTDRDGRSPVQRTRFQGAYVTTPRWSPDETAIAFVANGRLQVLDTQTARMSEPDTGTTDAEVRHPTWSPDGRDLYFSSNRSGTWQIWKLARHTGALAQVTQDGGASATLSADGARLFFTKPHLDGIWVQPVSGSAPATMLVPGLAPVDQLNWAVTAHAIYYVRRSGEAPFLHRFAFADATDRAIRPFEGLFVPSGLVVDEDTQRLWFVRVDRQDADLMLLERQAAGR